MMTHDEAEAFCGKNGGRLCRNYEIQNGCIARTGCDYDYTFVWGGQRCKTAGGEMGWMAGPGDQEKWQNIRSSCSAYTHCAKPKSGGGEGGVGMPNKESGGGEGDWIHKENGGVVTFMGVSGTLTADWIKNAAARYDYLEAMADLFLWPSGGTALPDAGAGTRAPGSRPDP